MAGWVGATAVLLAAGLATARPALADPVLRQVVLSSGGVGQFVFAAEVDGAAALKLDVPLDQVDDVLKSLVVDDPAGPSADVRLAGQQPLSESFRTLPFRPDAFASPEALLGSLVGEMVTIPATGAHGAILSVSSFDEVGKTGTGTVTRHALTIATASGIQTVTLEDAPDIEFTSPALRDQITTALAAIAAQRVQDRRTLLLTLAPGGKRQIRLGYVVSVPVWKTSYRLTLPADPKTPARLRAYAVVENLSGRDWQDVSVTLTSGRPVLFRTPLYQPRFTQRPEAPVDVPGSVPVAVDDFASIPLAPSTQAGMMGITPGTAAPSPAVPPFLESAFARARRFAQPRAANPAPAAEGATGSPSAVDQSVAQVAFHLAAPVTAASGQSMLLPILDQPVKTDRIDLFQARADKRHPLVTLRLTNEGAGALPPGLVALFEDHADGLQMYVGDARLPTILPGEQRLASFAVDQGVTVDQTTSEDQTVVGGKVSLGVLTLDQKLRRTVTYRVSVAKGDTGAVARNLLIEQPKQAGFQLVQPTGTSVTETPDGYRVARTVATGATETVALVSERDMAEQQQLAGATADQLMAFASHGGLPPALRDALARAASLQQDFVRCQAALTRLRAEEASLVADQARVRDNLMTVPVTSPLRERYLGILGKREDDLAFLRDKVETVQKQVDAADAALKAYLAELSL